MLGECILDYCIASVQFLLKINNILMNTPHIEYSQEKLKILDHKVLDIGYYNPIYEKNGYFFCNLIYTMQ
ncbi:hypothetical protein Lsan_0071 [Legionella santicrucis]|uniref:Uncharacterized protein n=1 Tax=Legionella santicrucis TaxID=45074 RepID=A0A0W0ZMG6_9GAMM|nr:hypothetical protein Lsan_0071 [Legionella santicrucis]